MPFCHRSARIAKLPDSRYPKKLVTLGDHLRKVRLDRGLSQPQTADSLLVNVSAVRSWEANRCQPEVRHIPLILDFIGYNPLPNGPGWPKRLYRARARLGLTQEQMAKQLNVGYFSYHSWERGVRQPSGPMRERLEEFLNREHLSGKRSGA